MNKEESTLVQEVVKEQPKESVNVSIEEVLKSQEDKIGENLERLIDKKVNERLAERENRIKEAELIVEQAERRRRLNQELESKLGYENYAFKIEKLENKFKYLVDLFNQKIQEGDHKQYAFSRSDGSSKDLRTDYFKEFAYAARTFGPEKMLNYFKQKEIGLRESKYGNIISTYKPNKYF